MIGQRAGWLALNYSLQVAMRRFFIESENLVGDNAVLTGAEARHIAAVLRLAAGDTVTLFDGSGSYFEACLTKVSSARVEARIVAITPYIGTVGDSRPELHLAIGLLKGKKMDFIVQKITELGLESLRPFRSRYCAVHELAAGRLPRWRRIAHEACKQCNRPRPPVLHDVSDFNGLISTAEGNSHDLKLIFWEAAGNKPLQEVPGLGSAIRSALVLIGPEGGFSPDEAAAAIAAGFQPVTLGRRILRAETAAFAAAAIVQYALGNMS